MAQKKEDTAMPIKKAEKSKKPKILQIHFKIHGNYVQSLVMLRSFLQWRWQWASIGNFVFLFYTGQLLAHICHKIKTCKRYFLAIASSKLEEPAWQLSLQLHCNNFITGSPAIVELFISGQITNVIEYKINCKK